MTLDKVTGYGIDLSSGGIAYVRGYGNSSEFWAYTITFISAGILFYFFILFQKKVLKW